MNNWDDEKLNHLKSLDVRYMVFGKEIGDQGTPHLQGYVYLHKKKSLKSVNTFFGIPMHVEVAKADSFCNREYCTKEEDFYEKGDRPLAQTEKGVKGAQFYRDVIDICEKGEIEKIKNDDPKFWFEKIKLIEYHRTRATKPQPDLPKLENY